MIKDFKFGLLGHNISYSKSIDIFNAVFDILDINGSCEIYDFNKDEFQSGFDKIKDDGVDGLSVTIPFKNEIISRIDEIDPVATALEAVNSVLFKSSKAYGYNTDCYGFSLPLRKYAEKLKHGTAVVFGAGGASKAAIYSLYTDYEINEYYVVGRNENKLNNFKESLESQFNKIVVKLVTYEEPNKLEHTFYNIIVNGTPLGGWNKPNESPYLDSFNWLKGKIYYDLNYNEGNLLIDKANQKGLTTIDGSEMLVGQAIRSFDLWTGVKLDFDKVYDKVFG